MRGPFVGEPSEESRQESALLFAAAEELSFWMAQTAEELRFWVAQRFSAAIIVDRQKLWLWVAQRPKNSGFG